MRKGKLPLIFLGLLAAGVGISAATGWLGYGIGHARAQIYPKDHGVLEFLPEGNDAVAIIDPHLAELSNLGGPKGGLSSHLQRIRKDIDGVMGVDLARDVDKLAITASLVVARGRFSADKVAAKLTEARYTASEHRGVKILARQGEDAVAVIDGGYLLYGDPASLRESLDAREAGKTLAKRARVTDILDTTGWKNALIAAVILSDEKPSVRAAVLGNTGPRSLGVAVDTKAGFDLKIAVEAASPSAAEETAKLLEDKRKDPGVLSKIAQGEFLERLGAAAKSAKISATPSAPQVVIRVQLDPPTFEGLTSSLSRGIPGAISKEIRLLQLLLPAGS